MNTLQIYNEDWIKTSDKVFWGEIAPCDHVVQIYDNDKVFLDLLAGYASGGVQAGDCVIAIATATHIKSLKARLDNMGYSIPHLVSKGQLILLEAEEALSKFMVNDWPDEKLFMNFVNGVLSKAKQDKRNVRAFGEMVAILWEKGNSGATVRLEHLWNKFCETEAFCLFCAYPRSGFTQNASDSLMHICSTHSKMITGSGKSRTDIFYKTIQQQ